MRFGGITHLSSRIPLILLGDQFLAAMACHHVPEPRRTIQEPVPLGIKQAGPLASHPDMRLLDQWPVVQRMNQPVKITAKVIVLGHCHFISPGISLSNARSSYRAIRHFTASARRETR